MPPDDFAADVERVWQQVRPLYTALHAYVRRKLRDQYGSDLVSADGPLPAHLLGTAVGLRKGLDPDSPKNLTRAVVLGDSTDGTKITARTRAQSAPAKAARNSGEPLARNAGPA